MASLSMEGIKIYHSHYRKLVQGTGLPSPFFVSKPLPLVINKLRKEHAMLTGFKYCSATDIKPMIGLYLGSGGGSHLPASHGGNGCWMMISKERPR